jgi:hypothetical protein
MQTQDLVAYSLVANRLRELGLTSHIDFEGQLVTFILGDNRTGNIPIGRQNATSTKHRLITTINRPRK